MKYLPAGLVWFLLIAFQVAGAGQSSCINCHRSGEWVSDTSVVADFLAADIHYQRGLRCVDCHGGDNRRGFREGDPELAMNPAKGFRPPPSRLRIPEFCARCHSDIEYMKKYNPRLPTDEFTLYKTSVHGKLLFGKKDVKVAVCTDCHGTHGILPPSDSRSKVYHSNVPLTCMTCHSNASYMKGYRYKGQQIPTNQYDQYRKSVHGVLVLDKGDQAAPACNNCHGNHGASPPNLASVSAACGECHATNRDLFNRSPHKETWQELGLPECEQCHGNHSITPADDSLIGVNDGAVCVKCHEPDSPGYAAAARMRAAIDSLKTALASAEALVKEAERRGVEKGKARFDLGQAKDNLIRARSLVHSFDPDELAPVTTAGIQAAHRVQALAEASLRDIKMRQVGLAISLILVIFVAFALRLKIKQVDKMIDFEVPQDKLASRRQ